MSAPPPSTVPPARRSFVATLFGVLAVQAVAIAFLWFLQSRYHG